MIMLVMRLGLVSGIPGHLSNDGLMSSNGAPLVSLQFQMLAGCFNMAAIVKRSELRMHHMSDRKGQSRIHRVIHQHNGSLTKTLMPCFTLPEPMCEPHSVAALD